MSGRHHWLDALRGLAAFQVMLLHYVSAFFPLAAGVDGAAHSALDSAFRHSPFFFLVDGYSAVYLFFLISGFVLAPAFEVATGPFLRRALARLVRLILPVLFSAPLALLALIVWRAVAPAALEISGSTWLANLVQTPFDAALILQDLVLNGTLLGYRGASVFGSAEFLFPIAWAINPPLWTLAYEVWGSLLLLALCALPIARPRRILLATLLILLVTGSGELSLFLLGYILSATLRLSATATPMRTLASLALIAAGITLCVLKQFPLLAQLDALWGTITFYSALSEFHLVSMAGAVLLFLGLLLNPWAQRVLFAVPLQHLGRLSFSFYLLHFPLMLLVGIPAFLLAHAILPYAAAALLGTLVGITTTIAAATQFYRLDRWSMSLARRLRSGPSSAPALSAKN